MFGARKPLALSSRTRVSCQSRAPSREFSRLMREGRALVAFSGADAQPAAALASAAVAPVLRKSRRVKVEAALRWRMAGIRLVVNLRPPFGQRPFDRTTH